MPTEEEKYTRVEWQDLPSQETPLSAENLNHMDNGIYELAEDVTAIEERLDELGTSDASDNTVEFDDDPSEPIDLVDSPNTLANIMTGIYSRVKTLITAVEDLVTQTDFNTAVGSMAAVEANTAASTNYASGDLFIHNNQLYRATAAISAGTQITNENSVETSLGAEIKSITSSSAALGSYVGMIIHSTTLSTESDVIATYGGVSWVQHFGYFLRGSLNSVVPDLPGEDGGSDTHNHFGATGSTALTAAQCAMPAHSHGAADSNTWFQMRPKDTTSADSASRLSGSGYYYPSSAIAGWGGAASTASAGVANASSGHTHTIPSDSNVPKYKNVYIWERTQ